MRVSGLEALLFRDNKMECIHDYQLVKIEDERFVAIKCTKCGERHGHVEFLGLELVEKEKLEV